MPRCGSRSSEITKVTRAIFTLPEYIKRRRPSRAATNVSWCARLVWFARLRARVSEVRWPLTGLAYSSFGIGVRRKVVAGFWYPTQYGERSRAPGGCVFNAGPGRILAIAFSLAASCSSAA
jgi:hypothetical protein